MAFIAIVIGMLVFIFSAQFIGGVILQGKADGIFPGLVLGIWAAWPLLHFASVYKQNLLHPAPKIYNAPAKVAFAKIRDILAEASYNYGDKWRVVTADTQSGRIMANLRFAEESIGFASDSRKGFRTTNERLQRFIELAIYVKDAGRGSAIIRLDFSPVAEGFGYGACDSIIEGISGAIESALGSGVLVGKPADSKLPAPPWWLWVLTAMALFGLLGGMLKTLFN
ncbi:MAG: hypothetical protein K2W82_08180 [Candidatus Obscuribacterales bacterium]|nr:hypothetical protein [Candidatus Obscuribacterales bacterium]